MRAYERLIAYAKIHTASVDDLSVTPSTQIQFDLAKILAKEMEDMGISDIYIDEHAYVYGKIPASKGFENKTKIGFLAHLDTIPDFNGKDVKPRLIENYRGGDIPLGDSGRVITEEKFGHLKGLVGKSLVVTDGNTLLGADDKAGIAEIMTAAEEIIKNDIPHGQISLAFCPDEEIGHGASLLDLDRFDADLAYTLDGGSVGEIEYENFNAAAARVKFNGFNVHPGTSKNTMINASLVAFEFNSMLPTADTPRDTCGYEGFFHLTDVKGNVESAESYYIIRDHDEAKFSARKDCMKHIADILNEKYGSDTVSVEFRDQYSNMFGIIKEHMEVVDYALRAIKNTGIEPVVSPIRGGTDGAQLSFRGLPCPNLSTGSYGHHGPYEHAVVEEMDQCTEIVINIVREFAK